MKVVTAWQMTAIEQASERAGVSTDALMENAGLAVARAVRWFWDCYCRPLLVHYCPLGISVRLVEKDV